jgi:predicted PurR-regulated permease PerM
VIASALRWASIFACSVITLSFLFFAVNQTSNASQNSVRAITGGENVKAENLTKLPNPPRSVEKLREKENDGFHEVVDDIDDVLLSPFTSISSSSNIWVRRIIPGLIGLLLYGIGLMYLARAAGLRRW